MNKVKENFSEVERFARKYPMEVLTAAAILVGALSSWGHFFLGTLGWSMLFLVIGACVGVFLPRQMDRAMKKIYSFSTFNRKWGEIFAEGVKIALALFVPFLYFGFFGIMAGTAFQYYMLSMHSGGNQGNKAA